MHIIINPNNISYAVNCLKKGEVLAIPTETVYGLAADISQEKAVQNIFILKNRPFDHPLIIHIANKQDLGRYAIEIPPYAHRLVEKFWPGPLTLVLKKSELVGNWVTGNRATVAIRMPDHPLTLQLIEKLGRPLAAPSANKFGKVSPTQVDHVIQEFGTEVKVLAGGDCNVGIESTIIDATHPTHCKILRSGMLSPTMIEQTIGQEFLLNNDNTSAPQVPGFFKSHYAPFKPCFLFKNVEEYKTIKRKFPGKCYLLSFSSLLGELGEEGKLMPLDPEYYARELYRALRTADTSISEVIAIEHPPLQPKWGGIIDRLLKATYGTHREIEHE